MLEIMSEKKPDRLQSEVASDLQIFIVGPLRAAPVGSTWSGYGQVSNHTEATTRNLASTDADKTAPVSPPSYLIIANSEAVEETTLALPIKDIVKAILAKDTSWHEYINIGKQIFSFIICQSIRDLYHKMRLAGKPVRITVITHDPELMHIPWELMCDSRHGELPDFIGYHPNVFLCRSLRVHNRNTIPIEDLNNEKQGPLRILLVASSPLSSRPIDVWTEEAMFKFVLSDEFISKEISFEVLRNPTVHDLRDKIIQFRPHVVHLACHGIFDRSERLGYILLSSKVADGEPDRVNAFRLAAILSEARSVQLVFLNTCFGAANAGDIRFSGLAQCLHGNGIPAVAALQFVLRDTTAHAIVVNFYRYLLQERLSIEESISLIRRHLFLDGHFFEEWAGLILFQGNSSLRWITPSARVRPTAKDTEFQDFAELFEKNRQDFIRRQMDGVPRGGIPEKILLKTLLIATQLCHAREENKSLTTAFIIMEEKEVGSCRKMFQETEDLPKNIFGSAALLNRALAVNGADRAFILTIQAGKPLLADQFIGNLPKASSTPQTNVDFFDDPRWLAVYELVGEAGCALILPGDDRVKMIVGGEAVAEYRNGSWSTIGLRVFRDTLISLSKRHGFISEVLLNALQKCALSAEYRQGRTMIIQNRDQLLKRCKHKDKLTKSDLYRKRITEFSSQDYLSLVQGDNAVLIGSNGVTLAKGAVLNYKPKKQIKRIPGTGSRHLAAQLATAATDALAIVVSENGPISIFYDGRALVSSHPGFISTLKGRSRRMPPQS